jgi:hypothetical protein
MSTIIFARVKDGIEGALSIFSEGTILEGIHMMEQIYISKVL